MLADRNIDGACAEAGSQGYSSGFSGLMWRWSGARNVLLCLGQFLRHFSLWSSWWRWRSRSVRFRRWLRHLFWLYRWRLFICWFWYLVSKVQEIYSWCWLWLWCCCSCWLRWRWMFCDFLPVLNMYRVCATSKFDLYDSKFPTRRPSAWSSKVIHLNSQYILMYW